MGKIVFFLGTAWNNDKNIRTLNLIYLQILFLLKCFLFLSFYFCFTVWFTTFHQHSYPVYYYLIFGLTHKTRRRFSQRTPNHNATKPYKPNSVCLVHFFLLLSWFFVCSWNEHRVVNVPNTPQIFNIIWNYLRHVDDFVLPNNTAVDCIQNMNSNFTSTDYKTFDEFSIDALIFVAHNNFERWKMMHARFALIRVLSISTDSLLFMTHNLHIYIFPYDTQTAHRFQMRSINNNSQLNFVWKTWMNINSNRQNLRKY